MKHRYCKRVHAAVFSSVALILNSNQTVIFSLRLAASANRLISCAMKRTDAKRKMMDLMDSVKKRSSAHEIDLALWGIFLCFNQA